MYNVEKVVNIIKVLESQFATANEKVKNHVVCGVALYGVQNYNLDDLCDKSGINCVAFVLPNTEDLVFSHKAHYSYEPINNNENSIKFTDIRNLINGALCGNLENLELLGTSYYYGYPSFDSFMRKASVFIDDLTNYNLKNILFNLLGIMRNSYYGKDFGIKDFIKIARCYNTIINLINKNEPYDDAIWTSDTIRNEYINTINHYTIEELDDKAGKLIEKEVDVQEYIKSNSLSIEKNNEIKTTFINLFLELMTNIGDEI